MFKRLVGDLGGRRARRVVEQKGLGVVLAERYLCHP